MKIQIVYTGRSYQIAERLPSELDLSDDATLDDALHAVNKCLSDDDQLPPSCLISISDQHIGSLASYENRSLKNGDELVLIAPVAGG
jgi:molybdopterin converting factor small subunit